MLTELDLQPAVPFEDGRTGGAAGTYEWMQGVARFAVDPEAHANRRIVDLEHAARDDSGRVRFEADICLLKPADLSRLRGILFVVANRGLLGGVPFSVGAGGFGRSDTVLAGDGFPLQRGWAVVWCGWQWDVIRGPGVVGIDAPQAL